MSLPWTSRPAVYDFTRARRHTRRAHVATEDASVSLPKYRNPPFRRLNRPVVYTDFGIGSRPTCRGCRPVLRGHKRRITRRPGPPRPPNGFYCPVVYLRPPPFLSKRRRPCLPSPGEQGQAGTNRQHGHRCRFRNAPSVDNQLIDVDRAGDPQPKPSWRLPERQ